MRKKGYRSIFREMLLFVLYQWEFRRNDESLEDVINGFIKNKKHRFLKALRERARELVQVEPEIDALIKKYSEWPFERIDLVDKIIMRIALFEMLYKSIPPEIAISEAVKLSTKFSSDKSYKFINGVLGRIKRDVFERTAQDSHSGKA